MAMAERQSAHRETLEAKVIEADIAKQTRGSIFGFIISLVVIIGGFVLTRKKGGRTRVYHRESYISRCGFCLRQI